MRLRLPPVAVGPMITALCLVVVTLRLGLHRAPWSQDETDLVSLAVSIERDARFVLRPDYHAVDLPDPDAGTLPALGRGLVAPPLASLLMSLPGRLGLPRAWPLAPALLFLFGVAALARALDAPTSDARRLGPSRPPPRLAHLAATALSVAVAPRCLLDALTLEAEVPLAGFAALGLAFALRARSRTARVDRQRAAAAAGVCLGLAFLTKLWLAGPPALAVLAALAAPSGPPDDRRRLVATTTAVAVAVGGLHIVLVAVLDPASLGSWLSEVYLGGILGTKMRGVVAHPEWNHGPFYYPAAIARELGGAGMVVLVATAHALRPHLGRAQLAPRLRAWAASTQGRAVAGMAAGVAVVSVPSVKEPLYVLPAVALGLAFAASGLVYLGARARGAWLAVGGLALVGCLLVPRPPAHDDPRVPRLDAGPQRLASGAAPTSM